MLHAHYGTMTSLACILACSKPLIITFRGSDLNYVKSDGILKNIIGKIFSHISAFRARRVICVSQKLAEKLFVKRSRVEVFPNGVNTDLFRPIPQQEARKVLGWNFIDKVVLFTSTNHRVKRLDIAQETIRLLRQKNPSVRLELLDGLHAHEDVPLYLNGADCLLLCSDTEGSPDIIKEALACNLPIVGVDVGDVVERLDGVSCSKVVCKKPEVLASAIENLFLSNQRSTGRDAIQRDQISEEDVADRILAIYQSTKKETEGVF
jgi:glycosyltransferase involved in cell wall biosynthesis